MASARKRHRVSDDTDRPRVFDDTDDWQATTETVIRSVVSIHFHHIYSFDTSIAGKSEATGFVVDAKEGYILTNRHVVGSGPFWGYCVFYNNEEVDVWPVYSDPIHDFAILKFDPKTIKYMPVAALPLRPDLAKVGVKIRVVGNDAGEKLSILTGVISRLDRNAPEYGNGYNDFNMCYYQASASASGGSSGSPVVNVDGYAVALQAGCIDGASTDFFLPLDRPLRALKCRQEGQSITRGDIQCQFFLKPIYMCRRHGLSSDWEAQIREAFPQEVNISMLVAKTILPEGPSHNKIKEGDILLKVKGELLTSFIRLDDIFDSSVGNTVKVVLFRINKEVEVEIEIGDLHKITPNRFVQASGGSFHDLSYQIARCYSIACKGVYVCQAWAGWYHTVDDRFLIQSIGHKETPDLERFIEVVKNIPDKTRTLIKFMDLRSRHKPNTITINIDKHWYKEMRLRKRDDVTGLWDCDNLADALPPVVPVRQRAAFTKPPSSCQAVAKLVCSFVRVDCTTPMALNGLGPNSRWGMGLVIDANKGLVVVSRAIIPHDMYDISITIADSISVEAKTTFLHPLQNYAIIQYDPNLVDAPVLSAEFSAEELIQGAPTYFIGHDKSGCMVHAATIVTKVSVATIPDSLTYRAINIDAITVDTDLGEQCRSGVLVAQDGTVQALWLTYLGEKDEYYLGLPTLTMLPVVSEIRQGVMPNLRMLPVEFRPVTMSNARDRGVPEKWIHRVSEANMVHHQLFMVTGRTFEQEGDTLLNEDILLTLMGKLITNISELDVMYSHKTLAAIIVRDGQELSLELSTIAANDAETDYIVSFCGATLHRPHYAIRQRVSKLFSEVYISDIICGSPAHGYGLEPTQFIIELNGNPVSDPKSFLTAIMSIPDNTCEFCFALPLHRTYLITRIRLQSPGFDHRRYTAFGCNEEERVLLPHRGVWMVRDIKIDGEHGSRLEGIPPHLDSSACENGLVAWAVRLTGVQKVETFYIQVPGEAEKLTLEAMMWRPESGVWWLTRGRSYNRDQVEG